MTMFTVTIVSWTNNQPTIKGVAKMQARPAFVIKAKDFGKSLAFYTEGVGYEVTEREPNAELAVLSGDGMSLLLAGPTVADVAPHAADGYRVLRQGIERGSNDL